MKAKPSFFILTAMAGLLLVGPHCCYGQTDTGLIATGDWSEVVTDGDGYALRGRLLVYDENSPSAANHVRLYLELQQVFQGGWTRPIEVYFDNGMSPEVQFALDDQQGQPVAPYPLKIRGPLPSPYWVTLPCDATVRLRADTYTLGPPTKPDGLEILAPGGSWLIPPDATNDFFLSATFTPAKDHPSSLNYHIWQGTLKLPRVKISVKKP